MEQDTSIPVSASVSFESSISLSPDTQGGGLWVVGDWGPISMNLPEPKSRES